MNTFKQALDTAAREYLKLVLEESYGHITEAAKVAGVSRQHLHKLIGKYGLKMERVVTDRPQAHLYTIGDNGQPT